MLVNLSYIFNHKDNLSVTWKHIFAKKDLEMLLAEMAGEHRLHRVLGPVALTALGVGCIVGAGIFVLTGVAAADFAGPSIIISFAVAGLGLHYGRLVLRRICRNGACGRQCLYLCLHNIR